MIYLDGIQNVREENPSQEQQQAYQAPSVNASGSANETCPSTAAGCATREIPMKNKKPQAGDPLIGVRGSIPDWKVGDLLPISICPF